MKAENYKFEVSDESAGKRLDVFITGKLPMFARTYIQKLILEDLVQVNGKTQKSGFKIQKNDVITLSVPEAKPLELLEYDFPLNIRYEDKYLIVVDKPAGIAVHPGAGNSHINDSLVNALLHHCRDLSGIGGVLRPGIVHRLDKDTSGLLIIAKTDLAHRKLVEMFQNKQIRKVYLSLVKGKINPEKGSIEAPIGRSTKDRKKMAINEKGKMAVTKYEVLVYFKGYSYLRLDILTGRTHQIRVHLSSIGFPVAGDIIYGDAKTNATLKKKFGLCRQFLHAAELDFVHPITNKRIQIKSDLPEQLQTVLDGLD